MIIRRVGGPAIVARRGRPGLVGTAVRTAVVAGTAQATVGAVQARQARRAQEHQPAAPAAPPVSAGSGDDLVQQLAELGRLRDAGVLTDDELEVAKRRLLG